MSKLSKIKQKISKESGVHLPVVSLVLNKFIIELIEAIKDGEISIQGFGKFKSMPPVQNRVLRGKAVSTRKKRRIRFTASNNLTK